MFQNVEFSVLAVASPGLLSRLLQPFAKRDLVPDVVEARREGDGLQVRLAMQALPAEMVHRVEGDLRQVVGVLELRRRDALRAAA